MSFATLVETRELASRLHDRDWVIIDCRHELNDPAAGELAYRQAHIPGALFMHVDRDLSAPTTGRNGRHPLPHADVFARRLSTAGIDESVQVVAYDAAGGMFASRLWWMLRWIGHDKVAVLNGGWNGWVTEGRATDNRVLPHAARRFQPKLRDGAVDTQSVLDNLSTAHRLLVDARAADRFRGENETLDPVAGHIPGAVNRPFRDNLDGSGRFKSASDLRAEFTRLLAGKIPSEVIHQCGSGVSACHNVLAMEIAGLPGSLLYPGSWSEWCSDPSRPVEKTSP